MERSWKFLRLWPWPAAVATGLLLAACFPPFNQSWLAWFALGPLLAAIWFSDPNPRRRPLRNLLLGYVAGLSFFWTVFSWLTTVTVPGWFLLQFYMAIYFAFFGWFAGLLAPVPRKPARPGWARVEAPTPDDPATAELRRSPWLSSLANLRLALLIAAGWVAHEWVRSWFFTGWGWNTLGSALHENITLIQMAEYTGVAGLSFIVAFANVIALASVRRFILETKVRPMKPHYDLTLTAAVILGLFGFGLRALQERPPARSLRVALLQPNVPRDEKFTVEHTQKTFDQFTRLTDLAVQGAVPPDLVVWPESAMPAPVMNDEQNHAFVVATSKRIGVDLLLGSIHADEKGVYNAALLVSNGGQNIQLYRKVHLVPFGEYVPGRHTLPLLARIIGDQVPSDFAFGTEHTNFRLTGRNVLVAPLICFEDTIGELTRQFVRGGSTLLANVTNDGWFKESAGSRQHLANAVFRCVETRRPMVRSANTGVTCFIDIFGRVTQQLVDEHGSQFTEGVLTGDVSVPLQGRTTFYLKHGEVFAHACAALTGAVLLLIIPWRWLTRRGATAPSP